MRTLVLVLSFVFYQANVAPSAADELGQTTTATKAAIRLCPGDHCVAVRFAAAGTQFPVYESQGDWLRLSPYKATGVPNLKVAEWVRLRDTRATAAQVAIWTKNDTKSITKNDNVNLLAKSDRADDGPPAKKVVRQRDVKREARRARRHRARRSKVAKRRLSIDKQYMRHLISSGECASLVEAGRSKSFKGYYYFLCENDVFYRLLTPAQIRGRLRKSRFN